MILIPKYRDLIVDLGGHPGEKASIKGEYRIERYDCMGNKNYDSGWVKNLITNEGLTRRTTDSGWSGYFYIGSGSTAPANTDTAMAAFLAASNTVQGSSTQQNPPVAPNYEKWNQTTRRFNAGVGTGTIREVGIGSNTSGGELFSRQLVSPALTKASDEVVDLTWRVTQYPSLIDSAGTVVIDTITYDYILRPIKVHQSIYSSSGSVFDQVVASNFNQVSDAGLVAITASGLAGTTGTSPQNLSSNGAGGLGYRNFSYKYGLDYGNLANGIRTINVGRSGPGTQIQIQFIAQSATPTPSGTAIPKDNTKELTINWRADWVRHP